jgi:hypothetical protein
MRTGRTPRRAAAHRDTNRDSTVFRCLRDDRPRRASPNFSAYPQFATFTNPARNSDRTSCPSMTSGQQRTKTSALNEKEATVHTVVDCKEYAEFLGDIPAFSNCAKEVLEEFVASCSFKVHADAGKTLCFQTQCDQNLYVLVSGSASLDAGDGVSVTLQAGDYFGRNPGRFHGLVASVIADVEVEVLVIRPQDVLQLERASSRNRHPSKIEWRSEFTGAPVTRLPRRRHRSLVAS